MISGADATDPLVRAVASRLAEHVGLDPASVSADAIERVLRRCACMGLGPEEILVASGTRSSTVHAELLDATCVGETYFLRHHEQLDAMRALVSARSLRRPLRVWSAGCSTGEEAYTVAACLRDVAHHGIEVLGTDIAPAHVRAARRGSYGAWSLRGASARAPSWLASAGDRFEVKEEIRALARFEVHNVLEPPPPGEFDVILCRNVLVYFSPAAASHARTRLTEALHPDGVLVLGPVDTLERPPGLEPCGPSWAAIFAKRASSELAEAVSSPAPRAPQIASPRAPEARRDAPTVAPSEHPGDSVRHHLNALALVERGDDAAADALLARTRPSYVPGLLERALLLGRKGQRHAARRLMEEVLARTTGLPSEQIIDGPAPLPAGFYRVTASTYLAQQGRSAG